MPVILLSGLASVTGSIQDEVTTYVRASGSDLADGRTPGSPKLTCNAAINALPLAADGISPAGIVDVGAGTFNVNSYYRADAGCSTVLNSNSVLDSHITAADAGRVLVTAGGGGTGIRNGAVIQTVNPGVSFTMNMPASGTNTNTQTAYVHQPGVQLYPGVKLKGRGRFAGWASGNSANYPTLIQDNGNGHAILASVGTGQGNTYPLATATNGAVIQDLCVLGNSGNMSGIYAQNTQGIRIDRCHVAYHGQWGVNMDINAPLLFLIIDSTVMFNGSSLATVPTGGFYYGNSNNTATAISTRFLRNYGFGCYGWTGVDFWGCDFSNNYASAYAGIPGVTMPCNLAVMSGGQPPVLVHGGWLENGSGGTCQIYVGAIDTYQTGTNDALVTIKGIHFQGDSAGPYGLGLGHRAAVTLEGCSFLNQTLGSIRILGEWGPGSLRWKSCNSRDPNWISSAPSNNAKAPFYPTSYSNKDMAIGRNADLGVTPTVTRQINLLGALTVNANAIPTGLEIRAFDQPLTVNALRLRVGTAPTGSSLNVTLNRNGAAYMSFVIPAGSTQDAVNPNLTLQPGTSALFTLNVTQIGSTVAGSDLTLVADCSPLALQPPFVQQPSFVTQAAGTTLTIPVSAITTATNTLILAAEVAGGATITGITDSKANTWTVDAQTAAGAGTNVALAHAYLTTALGIADTVTVTLSATAAITASLNEFTNIKQAAPRDVFSVATGAAFPITAGPTAVTLASVGTDANELQVSVAGSDGSQALVDDAMTAPDGWTMIRGAGNPGASVLGVAYQILTVRRTVTAVWASSLAGITSAAAAVATYQLT